MSNASSKPVDNPPAPTAAKAPWNPIVGVVYAVVVFFLIQVVAGILVSLYPMLQGWSAHRTERWLTDAVSAQFWYVLLAETLTIGAIIWFVRSVHKTPLSVIGLKRPRLRDPLLAVPAYIVYFVAFAVIVSLIEQFVPRIDVNQAQQIGFNDVHGVLPLVLTFVSLVILPPLAEEIVMRGFMFTSLRKALPFIWTALIVSAIFALAHLPEGGDAGPLYIAGVDTFLLSLVLCYLREKTGRIWAGVTLHAVKNCIAFATLFILHVH